MKFKETMEILRNGDPVLSQTAESVEKGEDLSALIEAMFTTMYTNKGIGLAANQVGVLKRVFVMDVHGFRQEFINPVIVKQMGKATSKEGCLSFPGVQVSVARSKQITIRGYDKDWKQIKRKLRGLAAYCAQHEIDHLDGVTIA